ncbi:MAG: hypothetical protein JWN04_562 [Myxococcaceae bacterium]|nr:hypothetical protein [Myxococcaceae bacterium]
MALASYSGLVRWWAQVSSVLKVLPPPLLLTVLPWSLVFMACGEPLFTNVAVIEADPAGSSPVSEAGAAARDATSASATHDADDCVVLLERSTVLTAEADAGDIVVATTDQLGCHDADAGISLIADNVFWRLDGKPLVQRGAQYSFRWPFGAIVQRVHIQGSVSGCPATPLIDVPVGLQTPGGSLTSCQEFTPTLDAKRLLLYGQDYLIALQSLASGPFELRLCRGSCPANTEAGPNDAGVASDASVKGYSIPKYP